MRNTVWSISMAAGVALLTAACGGGNTSTAVGGGAGPAGPVINGGVVKGPVLGATVCVYEISGGAKGAQIAVSATAGATGSVAGGCYVTPADGSYQFMLPANASGDILLEATGGVFCTDENQVANNVCAGATRIDLGNEVMSSVVTLPAAGAIATIYTTPLTTAAVGAAAGAGFGATAFNTQFNVLAGLVIGAGAGVTPASYPSAVSQAYLAQVASFMQGGGTFANAINSLQQGTVPGGGGGGGGSAVGLAAPFDFPDGASDETIMQVMAGEYDVMIISAPDVAQTGIGKLVVSYAGNDGALSVALKDANGTTLVTRSAPALSDRNCGDGRCVWLFDNAVGHAVGGRRLGFYNYYDAGNTNGPSAYANVSFFASGNLSGSIGDYSVRNGVYAAGTAIPAQFATLAGTYAGTAQQLLCNPNPVTVDISAGGSIRMTGKASVNCALQDVTVQWDGNDDFITTEPDGQIVLKLDSANIGGSQPGGGITLKLSDGTSPTTFGEARLTVTGAAGDVTTVNATRQ